MSEIQLAVVKVKDEVFGVDSSCIKQIVKYQDVKKAKNMPDFIEGFVRHQDEDIPVVGLAEKLGLGETEATKKTKILLTRAGEFSLGFTVDDVTELVKYEDREIVPIPDVIRKAGNSHIKYIGRKDDDILCILDLNDILSKEEADKLKEKSGS